MNIKEFRELDIYNAFEEFFSVEELFSVNEIPEDMQEVFPTKCSCGSDFMLSVPGLATMMCCNPKCPTKMSYALYNIFSSFSVKNVGPALCSKLISFGLDLNLLTHNSYIDVLFFNRENFPYQLLGNDWYVFEQGLEQIKSNQLRFGELIWHTAVPNFGKDAINLFRGVRDIQELWGSVQKDGAPRFLAVRGVFDLKSSFYLHTFLPDILLMQKFFNGNLIVPALAHMKIAITGSVSVDGQSMNRTDFIKYCNIASRGVIEISDCKAFNSVSFVVADRPSNSNTYFEGASRGILITADDFVKMLKGEKDQCQMEKVSI